MNALLVLVRPVLLATLTSCHTKKLVCELLDLYVKTTDNDVDDVIARTVRTALLKDCK